MQDEQQLTVQKTDFEYKNNGQRDMYIEIYEIKYKRTGKHCTFNTPIPDMVSGGLPHLLYPLLGDALRHLQCTYNVNNRCVSTTRKTVY